MEIEMKENPSMNIVNMNNFIYALMKFALELIIEQYVPNIEYVFHSGNGGT